MSIPLKKNKTKREKKIKAGNIFKRGYCFIIDVWFSCLSFFYNSDESGYDNIKYIEVQI